MKGNGLPKILVIDDEDTEFASKHRSKTAARFRTLHPRDVDLKALLWANLVLVDFKLDSWSERDKLDCISLKPKDGLALAAVLRRQLETAPEAAPTAFAIYTGQIRDLAWPLPPENRNHALARINNLEWVFEKGKDIFDQVVSLAKAVERLPQSWSITGRYPRERLAELLNINTKIEEAEPLLEDVEKCLPPIHELSQWSHGLAILRWLLHRILPYPCFLWDSFQVSARLRVQPELLFTNKNLRQELKRCEYNGVLSHFSGVRWWRSHVERFLWKNTDGKSSDINEVQKAVSRIAKRKIKTGALPTHPVVCVDSDYQPLKKLFSAEDAVRIQPDDWPAYADQAWTTIELAKTEPSLRALVVHEDLPKLK